MPLRAIRRVRRARPERPRTGIPVSLLPSDQQDRADSDELWSRLRSTVHPRFYAAQPGVPSELSDDVDGALSHFLATGAGAGARVSALFHEATYRRRLAERGIALAEGEHPFFHWLTVGWDQRIVPTPLFDEDYYVAAHADTGGAEDWAFAHFVRAGCYVPARRPGPFGPTYGNVAVPRARNRHEPVLLAGMLHRAEDYDLRSTSWLEEGVVAAEAKLAGLASSRMRDLVARAAAIEPLITQPGENRWASWPPHVHRKIPVAQQAERVRSAVGITRADTVVLLPRAGPAQAADPAAALLDRLSAVEPDHTALVLLVDGDAGGTTDAWGGPGRAVDLTDTFRLLSAEDRLLCLVDVLRGVRARRLVVAGSDVGWQLVTAYGAALEQEMAIGAFLPEGDVDEEGRRTGHPVRQFQECFDRLTWGVLANAELRADLVSRYVLPEVSRARLLVGPTPDDATVAAIRELEGKGDPDA